MAARPKLVKFVPIKKRNPLFVLLALVVAVLCILAAAYLWKSVFYHPGDAVQWVAATFVTLYAIFSSMAFVTGEGAWLFLPLLWGISTQ
jgi:hypothetical protein